MKREQTRDFEILLRSRHDVAVLDSPPWWNTAHIGWVVSACLLLLLGAIGLRTAVKEQFQLRALAMTDSLTGLNNRRSFIRLAAARWQQSARKGTTLLLFYFDLDHFKEINDTLGHQAGDHALQSVAEVLRSCFRESDVLARLGGDEFAAACDGSAEIKAIIEQRLVAAIEKLNRDAGAEYHLSLSVGALLCDASLAGLSFDQLMAKADALMYEKKRKHHAEAGAGSTAGR